MLNRAIAQGRLNDPKFHPIDVARIPLDRELSYRSKLDRRPEFLDELREYGRTKWRWFLQGARGEVRDRGSAATIHRRCEEGAHGSWAFESRASGPTCPSRIVTNHELAAPGRHLATNGSPPRPASASGGSRRPTRRPSDMGCQAALRCLSNAGVDKSAVDLIVVACATPDQSQPAVACLIQEKLGIAEGQCPAFDVNSVCAGFVFALNVAQGMMLAAPDAVSQRAGHRHRRVLQDPELERSAHLHLLRRRRRAPCCCRRPSGRRPAHPLPAGQRRARAAATSRCPAGGTRMPVDARGAREAPEHLHDGRPQGLGLRHATRSRGRSARCSASTASRPATSTSWSCTRATCA